VCLVTTALADFLTSTIPYNDILVIVKKMGKVDQVLFRGMVLSETGYEMPCPCFLRVEEGGGGVKNVRIINKS